MKKKDVIGQSSIKTTNVDETGNIVVSESSSSRILLTTGFTGSSNPSRISQISRHQDASTPYTNDIVFRHRHGSMNVSATVVGRPTSTNYSVFGDQKYDAGIPVSMSSSDPALVTYDNKALSIFRSKLSSKAANFKSLLPLAEIQETRHLLRDSTSSLAKLLQDLVRVRNSYKVGGSGLIRSADAFNKHAADLWLGWGFGIAPTLSDVNQLTAAIIQKLENSGSENQRISAKVNWSFTGEPSPAFFQNFCQHQVDDRVSRRYFGKIGYIGGFNLRLSNTSDYSTANHFGVQSLSEIVPAIWEATSYSWAVDYLVNIGPWLEDHFSATPGQLIYLNRVFSYDLFQTRHLFSAKLTTLPAGASYVGSSAGCTPASIRVFHYERQKLSSIPMRSLSFYTKDEILHNIATKCANILSVAYPRMRGRS